MKFYCHSHDVLVSCGLQLLFGNLGYFDVAYFVFSRKEIMSNYEIKFKESLWETRPVF